MGLYQEYRPTSFKDVVGHQQAIKMLQKKLQEDSLPRTILLVGQRGVGKTSIARILAKEGGCKSDFDLIQINCADNRGLDMVREIESNMRTRGISGGVKTWILDEVVQLPKVSQQAMLAMLEDTPEWVRFILCTSDPTGLLPTFLDRCFTIRLSPLGDAELHGVISRVLSLEKKKLPDGMIGQITSQAGGSARRALQYLEAILLLEDPGDQLSILGKTLEPEDKKVEFLASALMKKRDWSAIVKIVNDLKDSELDSTRYQILAYAAKVLQGGNKMGYLLIRVFESPLEAGRASFLARCYECLTQK